jgi:mannose-6-phosphate isomerase-like protein (cupin superfamily)
MVEVASTETGQANAKPVPLGPVQVVTTAWEEGERNVKPLARTDLLTVLLHHWEKGGEVALHHHTDGDATWVVLGGEVTFYGENDVVLAHAEAHQAVVVPRNTMYWFENSSDDPLVMFRVSARVGGQSGKDDRVYHTRG